MCARQPAPPAGARRADRLFETLGSTSIGALVASYKDRPISFLRQYFEPSTARMDFWPITIMDCSNCSLLTHVLMPDFPRVRVDAGCRRRDLDLRPKRKKRVRRLSPNPMCRSSDRMPSLFVADLLLPRAGCRWSSTLPTERYAVARPGHDAPR